MWVGCDYPCSFSVLPVFSVSYLHRKMRMISNDFVEFVVGPNQNEATIVVPADVTLVVIHVFLSVFVINLLAINKSL